MVDDNFSCIKEVTKIVQITLPDAYTSNEMQGVSDILKNWKRQYIQQLKGIVVNYKNVSVICKCAYIKTDCPVVHCVVQATFELFVPTLGSIVKGKITRLSYDYIGCLVHNTINVAVDRSCNTSTDISTVFDIGHLILFQITSLNFKRKIIRVRGKITQECINLMNELHLFNNQTSVIENNILTYSSHDPSEEHEKNDYIDFGKDEEQSQSLLSCSYTFQSRNPTSDLHANKLHDKISNSSTFHNASASRRSDTSSTSSEQNVSSSNVSPHHMQSSKKPGKSAISNIFNEDSSLLTDEQVKDHSLNYESSSKKKSKKQKHKNSKDTSKKKSGKDQETESLKTHVKKILQAEQNASSLFESSCFQQNVDDLIKEEIPNDYIRDSPKKKKSKQSNNDLTNKGLNLNSVHLQNSASQLSSSSKKKKRKKSKGSLNSPSLFDDSLSSSKDEIELFKTPRTPPKKKLKKARMVIENVTNDYKDFRPLLSIKNDIPTDSSSAYMSKKLEIKTDSFPMDYDAVMDTFSTFEPIQEDNLLYSDDLLNDHKEEPLVKVKKSKKRKHESPDKDGLPKKKKKLEKEGTSVNIGRELKPHKIKKKSKAKSKDSKNDKKRNPKKKIISSKKKLPKLKKKKKE